MRGDVVIQVEELGKRYDIAQQAKRSDMLREALVTGIRNVGCRLRDRLRGQGRTHTTHKEFWALRDVSLEVKRGEVVGIIGRNGAGKSTLLKILSRITEPTTGRARLRGRVVSLLEVGTGFHAELTGRENIYLNAAILGMSRAEIQRKFDDIVAFAEIDDFLDTPVKRYSSGMYIRLAFAVAAHLEPEILIIDEVLAVGDAAFQKKCLGKMEDVAKAGRTVLFVSHNMSAVRALCTRGIILDKGRMVLDATSHAAADAYIRENTVRTELAEDGLSNRTNRTSGAVRFTEMRMEDEEGCERTSFRQGETIRIVLSYRAYRAVPDLGFLMQIWTADTKECVTTLKTPIREDKVEIGEEESFCLSLPSVPLRPRDYSLYLCLGNKDSQRFYDVIDGNVSLPYLSITTDDTDIHNMMGYFSIPWRLSTEPAGARI